ncbi:hypothetical protein FRC05_010020 [Tulasnella sp. 425]|nr:hypothetical protein FRC05_010020 [Tulasnella sp. 425]
MEPRMTSHFFFVTLVANRHEGDSRRFTLVHDFDAYIKDAWDVEKVMPGKSGTAIKEAIQNTLSTTTTNSKVLFYFAGHGIRRGPEVHGGEASQSLMAGDDELINGKELRSWLCDVPDQSVSVTVRALDSSLATVVDPLV